MAATHPDTKPLHPERRIVSQSRMTGLGSYLHISAAFNLFMRQETEWYTRFGLPLPKSDGTEEREAKKLWRNRGGYLYPARNRKPGMRKRKELITDG